MVETTHDEARSPGERDPRTAAPEPAPETRLSGCLVRLGWMLFGNVVLLGLGMAILHLPPWTLTLLDVAFWAVIGTLLVLRYVDVTRLAGTTADGAPATRQHLRRYAVGVLAVGGLLWATVQAVEVRLLVTP